MSGPEWQIIKDEFPERKNRLPQEISDQRDGEWPMLSNDFPPWTTVSGYFRPWKTCGRWPRIDEKLDQEVGEASARHTEARAGMIDSQTVKTTENGGPLRCRPKIKARKGHLLVDRLGLIEAYQSKLRTDQIQMVPNGCLQK